MEPRFRDRYRVPSARLPGWNYSWPGGYAVTICVKDRNPFLGEVAESEVAFSPVGHVVAEEWQAIPRRHPGVNLDGWIVMPDHLHGILLLANAKEPAPSPLLGVVVGQFKKRVTKRLRTTTGPEFVWQDRYFDQILRDEEALERYRAYIQDNPRRWTENRGSNDSGTSHDRSGKR